MSGFTGPAVGYAFNGSSWDRLRTPNVFKTATATALGNTTVWTPAGGKKFRLMRFAIYVTDNCSLAAAGVEEIVLNDSGTAIGFGFSVWLPNAALATSIQDTQTGWIDLGNGYLSTTANNVLQINLGTALATGEARISVCGTEE